MSLKEEKSQEYNLRTGLSVLGGSQNFGKNSNSGEKTDNQTSATQQSNNSPPIKAVQSSSSSNVKLVGSSRFVIFQYLIELFFYLKIDFSFQTKNN